MWTPKRIVLLVVGFAMFFTTYMAYAHFMGGVNGLPPLPEVLWPYPGKPLKLDNLPQPVNEANLKLCQAFGEDCDEVKNRSMKVVLDERGLVLATDECNPEPDGRVKLKPFSLAVFGKPKPGSHYPEINTIRCNTALVTFDRPIKSQMEMGGRKIMACELLGTVTITNNRATPQKTDDVEITVMGKPLYYTEADHHVWSEGTIRLIDTQNVPYPTRVTANGMDLYLTTEPAKEKEEGPKTERHKAKKENNESISGVDRIVLRRNVHMNLYVDAKNGFPGSAPGGHPDKKEPLKRPSEKIPPDSHLRDPRALTGGTAHPLDPERAYVVIDTAGPFHYDMKKDLALFDIPPEARDKANLDYQVIVCREHNPGQGRGPLYDQLVRKHLELQFHKKNTQEKRADSQAGRTSDREIESAHAVGEVRLALDTESLEAQGDDLVYVAATPEKGPETTLLGAPLWAVKDCNVIQAKKLWLLGATPKGAPAQLTAQGPGKIDLADHPSDNPRHPIHVYWKDMLISNKDGIYDKLTLTGGASFVDDDHQQQLHGKRLEIWLEPNEQPGQVKTSQEALRQATPASGEAGRQRPHRVEAYQNVSAHSPDMNIPHADRLTVWFKDEVEKKLPGVVPAPAGGAAKTTAANRPSGGAPSKAAGQPAGAAGKPAEENAAQPKKPINLWGRSVVAHVNRIGPKNELDTLVAEGTVHVHQDGKDEQDKGVDITGDTLELIHYPQGDRPTPPGDKLVVLGKAPKTAYLQLGEVIMVGPKVTIDQKENTSEVQGIGYMNMPSNTTFEGGKPANPGARVEVHWNTGMVFDGKDANYYGGVIATQDNGRLKGDTLQVTLDRSVSLREGQQKGQSAKVEQMVCDGKVYAEDTTLEKGKLVRYTRLLCHGLSLDNQPAPVDKQGAPAQPGSTLADGPGIVFLLQPGAVDDSAGPAAPHPDVRAHGQTAAKGQPKEEMKLTRIEFGSRMRTDNQGASRRAVFYDNVDLINLPSEKVDIQVDVDHLPERGMHLTSSKLTVFSVAAGKDAKPSQVMIAEGKVTVRTPEIQARASRVSYEEAKDLLIFEGTEQNKATLDKIAQQQGVPTNTFSGRKIFYWRSTRQFKIEDGGSILNFN